VNQIKNTLRKLPDFPGIYQFLDSTGEIIYIGKAKNLKNRVKSYFRKTDKTPKIEKLVEVAADLKWIETNSEIEALTLEANLVKEFQPKFNALLRDDKHFLYFKITREDFPQILTVRQVQKDGAQYFGPKTDSRAVKKTSQLIQKLFKIRTCNLGIESKNGKTEVTKKTVKYPCLSQDIQLCTAPCVAKVSQEDYAKQVGEAVNFLQGNTGKIVQKLREEMQIAAGQKNFELATQLRDKIFAVENSSARQLASTPNLASRDVIGIKIDFSKAYLALLQVRKGKLVDVKNFVVKVGESDLEEILESFLTQYFSISTDFPEEILLPQKIENAGVLEEWLGRNAKCKMQNAKEGDIAKCHPQKCHLLFPQKGERGGLIKLAEKNAAAFAVQNKAKFENATEKTIGAAAELAQSLGILSKADVAQKDKISHKGDAKSRFRKLKRIEAYDISHFAGDATVASMVVFEQGEPQNSQYRHFKIRSLAKGEIDDCASLVEVLGRRMEYLTSQNPEIKIRRARKSDTEFLEKSFLHEFETGEVLSQVSDFMVAEFEKKIVAFAQIHFWAEAGLWQIHTVRVDEEFRGKKLGLKIIQKLLQASKAKKVYLVCEKDLTEYYDRIGLRAIRQVPQFLELRFKKWCVENQKNSEEKVFLMWEKKSQKQDTSFSAKPDLVILDGGKPQLGSVLQKVQFPKSVMVVGLAKKNEEIWKCKMQNEKCKIVEKNSKAKIPKLKVGSEKLKFEKILLPRNSQALFLAQRIRDEAHRFANSLRKKIQKI